MLGFVCFCFCFLLFCIFVLGGGRGGCWVRRHQNENRRQGIAKQYYIMLRPVRKSNDYPISGQCSDFKPLKTPENKTFSGNFRGYEMETLARNGLKIDSQFNALIPRAV